ELQKKATNEVKPSYVSYIEEFNALDKLKKEIEENKEKLSVLSAKQEESDEKLKAAKAKEEEISELKTEAKGIAKDEENYKKRDDIIKNSEKHKKDRDVAVKKLNELEEKKLKTGKEIERLEEEQKELKGSAEKEVEAAKKNEDVLNCKEKTKSLSDTVDKLLRNIDTIKTKKNVANEKFVTYKKKSLEKLHFEQVLDGCRAGILAMNLNEGDECPVCGSKSHPKLAVLPPESITEEEFEKYKQAEEDARSEKDEAVNKANVLISAFEADYENFKESLKGLLDNGLNVLSGIAGFDNQENVAYMEGILESLSAKDESGGESAAGGSSSKENSHSRGSKEYLEICSRDLNEHKLHLEKITQILAENSKFISEDLKLQKERKAKFENNETKLEDFRKKTLIQIEDAIKKTNNQIEEIKLEIKGEESLLDALKSLKFENWAAAFDKYQELLKQAKTFEQAIADAQKENEQITKEKTGFESSIKTKNKMVEENTKKCEEKKATYESKLNDCFDTEADFKLYVSDSKSIDSLDAEIKEYYQKLKTAEGLYKEALSKVDGKTKVDLTEKINLSESMNEELDKLRNDTSNINHRAVNNNKVKAKILDKFVDYEKFNKENLMHEKLYNLVKGKVKGNSKITLEQYVQASGFDAIIASANKRLKPMSDGQFRLLRKENLSGTSDILDLEVYDNFTGKTRPVGNISGGESFKASLSLALGLSDTISQSSGGIQMDALFIDEGFGTLDKKSIENAIEVLMNLSSKGKLVGIISHREELMDAIEDKINVTKEAKGSRFEVIS
ncbi:MAG: hypothetical protein K6G11_04885, partial [Lachnospiraceae bacterium]|nr:hypothetical protein [Lachnospiraceae bacterium]